MPALFLKIFPDWFVGFSFAAIAIGALVPAAIMSIGAANLFTRNIWRTFVNPNMTGAAEASSAKLVSLVVKFGALVFIIALPTQYAIDLQLLGGVWILQTFPAIVLGLYKTRLRPSALLLGWVVGMVTGTWLAYQMGLKPVYPLVVGGATYPVYIGVLAGALNLVVSAVAHVLFGALGLGQGSDETRPEDYLLTKAS